MVVPKSGYHFPDRLAGRIKGLVDEGSFAEFDAGEVRRPAEIADSATYPDRIQKYERESGLPER